MIWWFLISINFLFFLIKSFFTPKGTIYLNDLNNTQNNVETGLVSLEHYASNFKVIEILGSDTYPATKWKKLGKISTNFTKSFELFNIYDHCKNYDEDNCWVKYLKFIVLSHHDIEQNYYCTLTHLQIFASSGVDMLSDKIYSDDSANQIESDPENSDEQKTIKIQEQENAENLEALHEDKVLNNIKKQIHPKEPDSNNQPSKDNYYKDAISSDNFHNDKLFYNNIHNDGARYKNSKQNAHYTNYAHYLSIEKDPFDTNLLEKELTQSKLIDTDLIKKELMDTELIEDELLNYEFIEKDIKITAFNEENIFDNITQQMQREYGENKQYINEDTSIISNKGMKYNEKIIPHGDNTKNIQRIENKYIMHPKYYNKLLKDIQNVIILKNGKNGIGLKWTNLLRINPKYNTDLKIEPFNNINIEAMKIAYHISNKIYTICNSFKNYNISKFFKMSLITSYKHIIINFVQNDENITFFMNREKYNYDDYTKEENTIKYSPYKNYFNAKKLVSPFYHSLENVLIILYNSHFIPNNKWNTYIENKRINIKKNDKKKIIWKKQKCTALNTLEYYQNFIMVKYKHIILIKSKKINLINMVFFPKILCNNNFICLYTNREIYERLINNSNDLITNIIQIYRIYEDINNKAHTEKTNYEAFRCEQNEGAKFLLSLFLPKKLTKKKYTLHNFINNILKYNHTNINNNKRNTLFKYILNIIKKEHNDIQQQANLYISILNDTFLILYIIYRSKKNYVYTLNFFKNCIDFIFKWNKYNKSNILMLTINNESLSNKYTRIILMNIWNEYNILKKKNKILESNSQINVDPNDDYNGCANFYEIAKNIFNYDIEKNAKLETFFNENKNSNDCLYSDRLCHTPLMNNQNNDYTTEFVAHLKDLTLFEILFQKIIAKNIIIRYGATLFDPNKYHIKTLNTCFINIWNNSLLNIQKINEENENFKFDLSTIKTLVEKHLETDHCNFQQLSYITKKWKKNQTGQNIIKNNEIDNINYILSIFYRITSRNIVLHHFHMTKFAKNNPKDLRYTYTTKRNPILYMFISLINNRIKSLNMMNHYKNKIKNKYINYDINHCIFKIMKQYKPVIKINEYLNNQNIDKYQSRIDPQNNINICLSVNEAGDIIQSVNCGKGYQDKNIISREIKKGKIESNIVNINYSNTIDDKKNDNSMEILDEIKKTEESNSKLINEVYDIITEYDDRISNNYTVKLKTGKNVSLIVNKQDKIKGDIKNNHPIKSQIEREKILGYPDDLDKIIDDNINYDNYQDCLREEKIEEKSKNTRGHALLTLVDKVKMIENKNNHAITKLRDVIRITNNKTKIIYHMLSNFKVMQNTISLLLKYIMINEKNMKDLNKNKNRMNNILKILKNICLAQFNDVNSTFDSLKHVCDQLKDILYDEFEKKYFFQNSNNKYTMCHNTEDIIPHDKNSIHPKNSSFNLKSNYIFNFLYYENHCYNDTFKTPLIYYNSSVEKIQNVYLKIFDFFSKFNFWKYLISKFKYFKNKIYNYLINTNKNIERPNNNQQNNHSNNTNQETNKNYSFSDFSDTNIYVLLISMFLFVFIVNNFLCFILYKNLSNKLNAYHQKCACHTK
ncbi:Sad1/UNC domain-containing protein, putative [Plasmodium vinckei vinckei]|uniref:Sad1/UNC domain-containing protein, putative n=1 Tax=Plasmodium vinckei vinckei TaxID=54757 RepID=A0A449BXH2_PLAVN|nr:Sad1/UNC domain-containing protein, putative [Plasmodium vinckei vinckei]VEV58113.1 Sad1/UNC domain-containing protein, putative [Plasmodium vinckei vinckei]